MYTAFADWRTKVATLKTSTVTVDAQGVPVETETLVAGPLRINYWTDSSRVTDENDKFVDQALGRALLPSSLTSIVSTKMWLEIDGVKHHIIGVDDIAALGGILVAQWRRAYAE